MERQFFWSFARLSWVLYFDYFWSWGPINENTLTGLRPVFLPLLFIFVHLGGPFGPLACTDLPPLENKSIFPWSSGHPRQLPLLHFPPPPPQPSPTLLFSPKLSRGLGWRKNPFSSLANSLHLLSGSVPCVNMWWFWATFCCRGTLFKEKFTYLIDALGMERRE